MASSASSKLDRYREMVKNSDERYRRAKARAEAKKSTFGHGSPEHRMAEKYAEGVADTLARDAFKAGAKEKHPSLSESTETGPRGGRYYLSKSGEKVYVK